MYLLTAAFVTTRTDSFDKNALGSPQLFIIVRTLLVGSKRSSDFSTIFSLKKIQIEIGTTNVCRTYDTAICLLWLCLVRLSASSTFDKFDIRKSNNNQLQGIKFSHTSLQHQIKCAFLYFIMEVEGITWSFANQRTCIFSNNFGENISLFIFHPILLHYKLSSESEILLIRKFLWKFDSRCGARLALGQFRKYKIPQKYSCRSRIHYLGIHYINSLH